MLRGASAITPSGVAGTSVGRAEVELAGVERMEAVDVLRRLDRADHPRLVDVARQRQLHEDGVDPRVVVELGDLREQVVLGGLCRKTEVGGVDAGLDRGLVLEADVDLGRRIVADEDGDEADVADRGDLLGNLRADASRRSAFP